MASPQELLDLWNAALNPPYAPSRVGDLTFSQKYVDKRNEAIEAYNTNTNPDLVDDLRDDVERFDSESDDYYNHDSFSALELDPYMIYSMEEILDKQTEMANRTFIKYEE